MKQILTEYAEPLVVLAAVTLLTIFLIYAH